MSEQGELKHATLEPDQTLRFRALELAILSERELRHITLGKLDEKVDTWAVVTRRMIDRADDFYGYIKDSSVPSDSGDDG